MLGSPPQSAPPQDGAGLVQVRVLVLTPVPQVCEQLPSVHADHPPGATQVGTYTVCTVEYGEKVLKTTCIRGLPVYRDHYRLTLYKEEPTHSSKCASKGKQNQYLLSEVLTIRVGLCTCMRYTYTGTE